MKLFAIFCLKLEYWFEKSNTIDHYTEKNLLVNCIIFGILLYQIQITEINSGGTKIKRTFGE